MFESQSSAMGKVFMEVVAGLTVVYYVYVGVRFYWRDVLAFFTGQGGGVGTNGKAGDTRRRSIVSWCGHARLIFSSSWMVIC